MRSFPIPKIYWNLPWIYKSINEQYFITSQTDLQWTALYLVFHTLIQRSRKTSWEVKRSSSEIGLWLWTLPHTTHTQEHEEDYTMLHTEVKIKVKWSQRKTTESMLRYAWATKSMLKWRILSRYYFEREPIAFSHSVSSPRNLDNRALPLTNCISANTKTVTAPTYYFNFSVCNKIY